jgi:HK97 family phage prohead protease
VEGIVSDFEILNRGDATLKDVDFKQRLITVIAVPWGQEAQIFWRGEFWNEVFERGAFDGLEEHAGRVRVNREHTKGDTVGKLVKVENADAGLITFVRVAKTPRGDETLTLADEDMIGASVGYRVKNPSDVELNRQRLTRRVKRAFLDHLSFVESPAFEGAKVLAVREGPSGLAVAETPLPATPILDEFMNDDVLLWARSRVSSRQ